MRLAVTTALHDRFKRDVLVRHAARDRRGCARLVDGGEPDVVAALVALDRSPLRLGKTCHRPPEGRCAPARREIGQIGDDRGRGRGAAGAGPQQGELHGVGIDRNRVGDAIDAED